MTSPSIAASTADVVAAIETMLYSAEDILASIVERMSSDAHDHLDTIADALSPVVARAVSSVDVSLPDEDDSTDDASIVGRITSDVRRKIDDLEVAIGSTSDALSERTNARQVTASASINDLIGGILESLSNLISGLYGSVADTAEFWHSGSNEVGKSIEDNITHVIETLSSIVSGTWSGATKPADSWLDSARRQTSTIVDPSRQDQVSPQSIADIIRGAPPWLSALAELLGILGALGAFLQASQTANLSSFTQASLINGMPTPLTAAQLSELQRRGFVGESFASDEARRSGYTPELFKLIYNLTQNRLTANNYVEMWRRTGKDSELDLLKILGLEDDDIARLRELALSIPTPSDLVRFMVRDVFDPSAVADGDLGKDFANKYDADWARKVGVDEATLKLYWQAHWQLPSPTMFYEMFHRGYIDEDKMRRGLELADYAPGWIDNLIKINYNVPGRIDVRRMYEAGVITTRDELVRRHQDMGYSPEDANTLANFVEATVARTRQHEADRLYAPIIGEVIQSYADGGLPYDQALSSLTGLGLAQDVAEFKLQAGIFERERDHDRRIREAIKREYVHGFMSESDARSYLESHGFETSEQDSLFDSWALDKELRDLTEEKKRERDLSKSELLEAYREHIISESDAQSALQALGYDAAESATLVQLENERSKRAETKASEQAAKTAYITRRLTDQEARVTLASIGYTETRINALLDRWTIEREERRPDISNSQVERMLMQGVIGEDRAEQLLVARGYTPEDVALLMTLYGTDMSIAADKLAEQVRQFEIREERLRTQGSRRLDLVERGQDIGVTRFDEQQRAVQQRFDAQQEQQRALQTERIAAQTTIQTARIAAQTASDARAYERRLELQNRQLQAAVDRQEAQIQAASDRQTLALANSRELADQRAALQREQSAARDAAQARALAAQDARLAAQQAAADRRQAAAQDLQRELNDRRNAQQQELTQLRARLQETRDIRQSAERIAAENRQESQRVRTETRADARRRIASSEAAANDAALRAIQLGQTAEIAEVQARFAGLQAQLADQRRSDALAARQLAEQLLAQATPPSSFTQSSGG